MSDAAPRRQRRRKTLSWLVLPASHHLRRVFGHGLMQASNLAYTRSLPEETGELRSKP
jgi:hypothetical protein